MSPVNTTQNTPYHLYSTDGCHLCELAYELVAELAKTDQVEVVDIIDDEDLVAQYRITIPVIKHLNSGVELGWPFDAEQLSAFFANCQ